MKSFFSLFGLIGLGLIIENFPWSDRNVNYLSGLVREEDRLIKKKLSRLTSANECLIIDKFPDTLKRGDVTRFSKKGIVVKRKTIAQCVCSPPFQKSLKNYYLNKIMTLCKVNSQSI